MASSSSDLTKSMKLEGVNIGSDLSEAFIDTVMTEGVLKEIPIVKTAIGLYNIGKSYQAKRYVKNLIVFIKEFSDLPNDTRDNAIDGYLSTDDKRNKFGETMLVLIETADDIKKPQIYARLLELWIRGECLYEESVRCCRIVDRVFYSDLVYLMDFNDDSVNLDYQAEELYKNGLLSYGGIDGGEIVDDGENPGGMIYQVNKFGELVRKAISRVETAL